jgi:hypothetical protein
MFVAAAAIVTMATKQKSCPLMESKSRIYVDTLFAAL